MTPDMKPKPETKEKEHKTGKVIDIFLSIGITLTVDNKEKQHEQ